MISDIFQFSEVIRNISVDADHILVSYDVMALFTNVPAYETIGILAEKAFAGNWFNKNLQSKSKSKYGYVGKIVGRHHAKFRMLIGKTILKYAKITVKLKILILSYTKLICF